MGGKASKPNLQEAISRAEEHAGKLAVSGRYHRLPKKIEDDYIIAKKVLGTGYNGSVYLAKSKNGQTFAVKGFHLHGVTRDKMLELETEAEIFLRMDHPHVARLVAVYQCENMLNLVMECMEGGELFERVVAKKRFGEKDAANAVWQMLLAINYIHSRGVVHRDLKLENFLYEKPDTDHLKLIDFGFSHVWAPNTKMAMSCGTLAYVAPEVLNKSYTSKCDLWSLGVIVFILLVGYMPFSGSEEHQMQTIKAGRYTSKPEKWAPVSSPAKDFVKKLLVVDPDARLSAEEALAHPWIANRQIGRPSSAGMDGQVVEALHGFAQASQFRRACMSVMAWSLTNEERAKVRDAFIELDTNKTGTITMYELKTVLLDKFQVQDAQVSTIFEALDTTQNEEIHYSEFLAAMVSTRIAMHDDLLHETFKRFDVDSSGYITLENLQQVLGETFDGEEVKELMKEADGNLDSRISLEEFEHYIKESGSEGAHKAACKLIDKESANTRTDQPGDALAQARPEGHLGLAPRTPSQDAAAAPVEPPPPPPVPQKSESAKPVKSKGCIVS